MQIMSLPEAEQRDLVPHFRRTARIAATLTALMAVAVLVGWWRDVPAFTRILPDFAAMKANTAVAFLAGAVLVATLCLERASHLSRRIASGAAAIVTFIGAVTLLEWVFDHDLGIDHVLLPATAAADLAASDRMSLAAALALTLFGLSGLLAPHARFRRAAHTLQAIVLFGGFLGLSGYVFGERDLFTDTLYTTMALHTSLGLFLLGLGAIMAQPESGLGALITRPGLGSTLLRRTLPFSVSVLAFVFWIGLSGQHAGLYGHEFGVAITFVAGCSLLAIGIGLCARHLNFVEDHWHQAEAKLRAINAEIKHGLHESEARTTLATETAQIGVWDWNLATNDVLWDEQMHLIYGLAPTPSMRVSHHDWLQLVHHEDIEAQLQVLLTTARDGARSERAFRILRASDGEVRHLQSSERAVLGDDGRPVRVVGVIRDVTEARLQEESLRRSLRQITAFKTALNSCAIVAMTDVRGTITEVNDNFCAISGYRRDELIGQNHRLLNSGRHPPEFFENLWRTISRGKTWRNEICNRAKDGSFYWVDTTIAPMLGENGKPAQYLALRIDITDVKRLEASLSAARDEALEASRLKSEFLATMSHEIRTPMNAIIGMSGLLAETTLNEDQAEMVHTVGHGAESLLGIINDILDFSKIEAGQLRLDLTEFDLRACVEETLTLLAPRAHQKGVELAGHFTFVPQTLVWGDSGRLRQILLNLVGNAVKFTDHGEVTVSVQRVLETELSLRLRIEVTDTGIGMDDETRRNLFQPFMQADGSITRRFGGTGLGLAITRKLVSAMGGDIGARSVLGQGSTFWIELDLERRGTLQENIDLPKLAGHRVLIVDDNTTNQNILLSQLAKQGMIAEADDGPEGFARLTTVGEPAWDVVLLDWNMPRLNGREFLDRLHRLPGFVPPPIIVLSSAGPGPKLSEDNVALVSAFLTKPVPEAKLLRCLAQALGDLSAIRPARVAPSPASAAVKSRPLHILLVEDNIPNQRVASLLLAKLGHSVEIEENGERGLSRLACERFDVVLMDCQMPVMDGFEATRRIRSGLVPGVNPRLPIIALTAYARNEDQARCRRAGMDGYLSKPIRPRELSRILDELVVDIGRALPIPPEPLPADTIDTTIWDALKNLPGRKSSSLLPELIALYRAEEGNRLDQIDQLLASRQGSAAGDLAHLFGGSAATLGAMNVKEYAINLEHAARAGDWERAFAYRDRLHEAVATLRDYLDHAPVA